MAGTGNVLIDENITMNAGDLKITATGGTTNINGQIVDLGTGSSLIIDPPADVNINAHD